MASGVKSSLFPFLGLIGGLVGYQLLCREGLSPETLTVPYSELDESQFIALDRFDNESYDPRRSCVSILSYIEENCSKGCKVPLSWDQLIDIDNKTELGVEFLKDYSIERLFVMKNEVHEYEVDFGKQLELIDVIKSITGAISTFFFDDQLIEEQFKEIELSYKDFKTDNYIDIIQSLPNSKQRDYLLEIYQNENVEEFRYFKEGSILHNKTLGLSGLSHYDLRFYNFKVEPIDRVAVLHRIVRSWAKFTRSNNLKTWIAHGSLLGYYFNGLILPWDDDLDVQITLDSFWELLKLNGTLVVDYQDELNPGKYLIDVNPWFLKRDVYNPENKIDARFIDLETGLYIDITVLTINENITTLDDLNELQLSYNKISEISKVFEPFHDQILTETLELQTKINSSIDENLHELISCKDYHFYKLDELSPLIPNIYEGEIFLTPKKFTDLLMREYQRKSLYLFEFKGFKFDRPKNLWINENKIRYEVNKDLNNFNDHHYNHKRTSFFKKNEIDLQSLDIFKPFRIEPWIRNKIES